MRVDIKTFSGNEGLTSESMECEVCGCPIVGKPRLALIEGVAMNVCSGCATLGKIIEPARHEPPSLDEETAKLEIVEDYPVLIRRARERMGLKQEELAKRLAERASVVQRLESGRLRPDERLLDKLERALGIKLSAYESRQQPPRPK
jgi:putative transcription factor